MNSIDLKSIDPLRLKRTKRAEIWPEIMHLASCKTIIQSIYDFLQLKSDPFFLDRIGYETTNNCILGASALGSRNEKPFESGKKVAAELINCMKIHSCVDPHVQDQLIIFMALAKGISRIRCTVPLTLHTKTAIYIAELLTAAKFNVIEESGATTAIIECNGIGYENSAL